VSRMNERARRLRLDDEAREAVDKALREGGTRPVGGRSAAGDPRALRGLPMIGGAGGAIPGTLPHRNRRLDRWSGR
jgi:hypothetical protein